MSSTKAKSRQTVSTEATRGSKRFWKYPAELPQMLKSTFCCLRDSRKRQSISRGTCGTPANTKEFPARLAGLPQTPKSFSRDLRDSRKHQKVSRETCGTPANAKKFSEALAGLPQTPKSFPRDLRDSRKGQGKKRACGGSRFPVHALCSASTLWMNGAGVTWRSSQAISTCRA